MDWWFIALVFGGFMLVWSVAGFFIYFMWKYNKKVLIYTVTGSGLRFELRRAREEKEGEFDFLTPFPAFLARSKHQIKPAGNKRINFYWGRYEVTPIFKIRDDYYDYVDFSPLMEYKPVNVIPSNVQKWNELRKVESFTRRQKRKDMMEKAAPMVILGLTVLALIITAIYTTKANVEVSDNLESMSSSCVSNCIVEASKMCAQTVPQQRTERDMFSQTIIPVSDTG